MIKNRTALVTVAVVGRRHIKTRTRPRENGAQSDMGNPPHLRLPTSTLHPHVVQIQEKKEHENPSNFVQFTAMPPSRDRPEVFDVSSSRYRTDLLSPTDAIHWHDPTSS